ncbi:MAG: hypothetical protein IJA58_06465 [Lachnospiraceae bacterium]|nr:hypothetical protein [Lachnospiraceae bacterium]
MKRKLKSIVVAFTLFAAMFLFTACGEQEDPYRDNDAANYNVSVKYDANGGMFTTNTSVIVDSYNISDLKTNSEGNVEIALLSPDNSLRGKDAFTAQNSGYFLAGWYAERTETLNEQGEKVYVYNKRWDFEESRLEVNPDETYSASEPVITLYAAWVPLFEIEFYALDTGEYLNRYTFNPEEVSEIKVPVWDEKTGAIEMFDFPERAGYTFDGVYLDAEGKEAVDTLTVTHPGTVDYVNGAAKDSVLKLYVDWKEGEWYHIYTAKQFKDNASVNGNYVLHADLDFADEIWPTSLMYGNYSGTIEGNGYTIKNVQIAQTNNSKVNAGMFGHLTEKAVFTDLTFENITFTIKAGTRVVGTSYGLLAGTISAEATFTNVAVKNSTLQIDSGCYFGADDYVIGLVCGMGDPGVIDYSGITCEAVGEKPESVKITINGNSVEAEIVIE